MQQYKQDTDMTDEELWRKIKGNLDATVFKLSRPASVSSSLYVSKEKVHMDDKGTSQEVDTDTAVDDTPFDLVPVLSSYEQLGPPHDVPTPNVWQYITLVISQLWGAIMVTVCIIIPIVGPFSFSRS